MPELNFNDFQQQKLDREIARLVQRERLGTTTEDSPPDPPTARLEPKTKWTRKGAFVKKHGT